VPYLAWPLIRRKGARGKTETIVINSKKSQFFCLYSREIIFQGVHIPCFFHFRFSKFLILLTSFLCFLLFPSALFGQDVTAGENEDPYIDPVGASKILQPTKRVEHQRVYMFGISYGLNPVIILAPALSAGMYWDPVVIGLEISDSEHLGFWEKERRENFGPSRMSGDTQFLKWFYGENFYLIAAREKRSVKLWTRTYNRTGLGRATFDMFFNTTVVSLGTGLLRFNEIGFLAIDIIRLSFLQNQSVEVIEHWETWSELSGSRERLDQNIREKTDKWFDWLDSPTGFVVTVGVYF